MVCSRGWAVRCARAGDYARVINLGRSSWSVAHVHVTAAPTATLRTAVLTHRPRTRTYPAGNLRGTGPTSHTAGMLIAQDQDERVARKARDVPLAPTGKNPRANAAASARRKGCTTKPRVSDYVVHKCYSDQGVIGGGGIGMLVRC